MHGGCRCTLHGLDELNAVHAEEPGVRRRCMAQRINVHATRRAKESDPRKDLTRTEEINPEKMGSRLRKLGYRVRKIRQVLLGE
jgi:hypothetical protein